MDSRFRGNDDLPFIDPKDLALQNLPILRNGCHLNSTRIQPVIQRQRFLAALEMTITALLMGFAFYAL